MVELVDTRDFRRIYKLYKDCKIYGPYKGKDGRERVVVIYPNGNRTTVSYPKYLTECRLGRYLSDNETVDHTDTDFNNNVPSNIEVKDRSQHVKDDVRRYKSQSFICPGCGKKFLLSGRKLHDAIWNRKRNKAGPFCSRSCAGKYGKSVQLGEQKLLPVNKIIPEYTTNKSNLSLHEKTHGVDTANSGKP